MTKDECLVRPRRLRGEDLEDKRIAYLKVAAYWSWLVPMDAATDTASPLTGTLVTTATLLDLEE